MHSVTQHSHSFASLCFRSTGVCLFVCYPIEAFKNSEKVNDKLSTNTSQPHLLCQAIGCLFFQSRDNTTHQFLPLASAIPPLELGPQCPRCQDQDCKTNKQTNKHHKLRRSI